MGRLSTLFVRGAMGRLQRIVWVLAMSAVCPALALAATFTVTKTADTNDGTCDTDCSLREAIVAANASAGLDTVTVPAGSYVLTLAGAGEDGSASGDLDVTDDLVLTGAGAANTSIVGDGTDRVIDVDPFATGASATVSAVTVTNGRAVSFGGGIRNSGVLMLSDSTLSDNRAEATQAGQDVIGGGVGTASGGVTSIATCAITANRVTSTTSAGATMGAGIGTVEGQTDVVSSTISDNVAFGTSLNGPTVGGGIAILGGDFSLTSTTVVGNEATGAFAGAGGGVAVFCDSFGPCGSVALSGNTINENEAFSAGPATGGGLYMDGGSFFFANSTVSDNSAKMGFAPGVGVPTHGGALAIWGAAATIASVTFEAGVGLSGIDFQNGPTVTFRNTIVADSCSGTATVIADAHNLEYPGNTCGFSGTDLTAVDPLLGPLADHGGPTETMTLTPGSPAINGGDPAAPGSGGDSCEADDQRGVTRPIGARCDIGAYESDCGDGGGDPGEGCDDGLANGTRASCCSASCLVRPNGSSCEDGNVCTRPDTCQGGVCTTGPCATGACTFCGGTCSDAGGSCECVF